MRTGESSVRSPDLYLGDCLFWLAMLPDNSVDAVVTDPPYGLSFMGKKWDYDVPSEAIWRECLRVLKPGGHLLAFAGTRTQHRMAVRIEDAGFEIRDMIAWVYGSGFPKSLDVSKAIDKMDASEEQERRRLRFTAWVRSTGVTSRQIDEAIGTNTGGHYTTAASQPAIMTREHLEQCRHLLGDVPEWVEREVDIRSVESRNMAKREVLGCSENGIAGGTGKHAGQDAAYGFAGEFNITAPATEAARQWQGWGTALKPALEPITVARKPLVGTVAENVLAHGTGALNIDGCRVGDTVETWPASRSYQRAETGGRGQREYQETGKAPPGRWPANLIHDGSEEVVAGFPETGVSKGTAQFKTHTTYQWSKSHPDATAEPQYGAEIGYGDTGSAARFFYCAKASKRDRDEGCEGFEPQSNMRVNGPRESEEAKHATKRSNHHPTVKPTDLMRYLCRLVTPPGGTVLDPFMGSGSTGKAAALEGFHFIGMERDADYFTIAQARIDHARKAD